jgi:hypothetical protein
MAEVVILEAFEEVKGVDTSRVSVTKIRGGVPLFGPPGGDGLEAQSRHSRSELPGEERNHPFCFPCDFGTSSTISHTLSTIAGRIFPFLSRKLKESTFGSKSNGPILFVAKDACTFRYIVPIVPIIAPCQSCSFLQQGTWASSSPFHALLMLPCCRPSKTYNSQHALHLQA